MADHPWCRDVARDEAVRAAEDAVERPAVPEWRELPERVARLEREVAALRAPVAAEGEADVERLRAERDAAIRERDAALARVAELEAQRPRDLAEALEARRPGAEPVAWATCCSDGSDHSVWCMREDAESEAATIGGKVVPLYRSPPPRGWLTAEECVLIARIAHNTREHDPVSQGRPYFITVREASVARSLLARNAPPKVRMPSERACENDNPWAGGWNALLREVRAALAAAGVEVEE
jgi:hypothetical protein